MAVTIVSILPALLLLAALIGLDMVLWLTLRARARAPKLLDERPQASERVEDARHR